MSRTLIVFVNNTGKSFVAIKETGKSVHCVSCVHYGRSYPDAIVGQDVARCALLGNRVTANSACTGHEHP